MRPIRSLLPPGTAAAASRREAVATRFRTGAILLAVCGLAGCVTVPPAPLAAGASAQALTARSLQDESLRRFLADNAVPVPAGPWNLKALSWVAFYYHPSLALARAQWATAQAARRTAAQRPNPTLSLTPGYNTTRAPGLSPWFPSVNLDFLLPTNGKRARQQDLARADAEAARLAVVTAVWSVRGELRRALLDATLAERRAAQAEAQAGAQKQLLDLLDARVAAGGMAAVEVAPTRGAWLRAEAAAAEAQAVAVGSRARVAAALGIPAAALEGVALALPPAGPILAAPALAAATREALQSRADVLAGLARYESAQAALDLDWRNRCPTCTSARATSGTRATTNGAWP